MGARLANDQAALWPKILTMRAFLQKFTFLRFLALYRNTHGALGQLGWKKVSMGRLLVSGDEAKPWLVYGATDFLEHTISPSARILELGGGGSTLFWLNRGNEVVTIENDGEWFCRMKEVVGTNPNWKPYLVEEISIPSLEKLNLGQFDVIVNDFIGDRSSVTKWIENRLNLGGFIVWDNSDRASETVALDSLKNSGYGHIDFFGLSPINSFALQTTVLSKSLKSPNWEISRKKTILY
jgi:hypothetical protein